MCLFFFSTPSTLLCLCTPLGLPPCVIHPNYLHPLTQKVYPAYRARCLLALLLACVKRIMHRLQCLAGIVIHMQIAHLSNPTTFFHPHRRVWIKQRGREGPFCYIKQSVTILLLQARGAASPRRRLNRRREGAKESAIPEMTISWQRRP